MLSVKVFATIWVTILLACLAIWAAAIFVGLHFLLKVW